MAQTTGGGGNVGRYLQGVNFPCRKSDILRHARDMNANQDVIEKLNQLPDQQFSDVDDVQRSLGSRS